MRTRHDKHQAGKELPSISRTRIFFALLLAVVSVCAGCRGQSQEKERDIVKRYSMSGEVIIVIPTMQRAVIRHDAIEGWSSATTMEYPVRDPKEFLKLSIGDKIRATVHVQNMNYWLGEIEVVSRR